jgi:RimJ/RimL family protein N-acetyltransferase
MTVEGTPDRDRPAVRSGTQPDRRQGVYSDWQSGLPPLAGRAVSVRELRPSDSAALFTLLATEEVARFISPPPTTVEAFERFTAWTLEQRRAGSYACFAITMHGFDTPIGIIQVRAREADFSTAEWGFAIGSPFWGTGVFYQAAQLVLKFVFDTLGTRRLEARAAAPNGRGQGALLKLGAVKEGVLRSALRRNGIDLDQVLYTILAEEWRERRMRSVVSTSRAIH